MFVSFSVGLLTLVAIVWGIIESSQGFYYVEVIPSFQRVDLMNFPRLVFSVWNVSSSKLKSLLGGRGGVLVGFGGLFAVVPAP